MSEEKKSEKSEKVGSRLPLYLVTPFLVFSLCLGLLLVVMIKPYDKLKVYLNVAFMDNLKSDPLEDNTGLVIKNNEILEEYSGETSDTGEVMHPSFGEQFAIISSDVFEVDVPVYWGSEAELLELGACQPSGSVVVGSEGNAVISAHVDTFFANLTDLQVGDSVQIKTNYGKFDYKVSELIEFKSTSNKYLKPTDDTRLTLYTCKKDVLGGSDMRVGVICTPEKSVFYKTQDGGGQ